MNDDALSSAGALTYGRLALATLAGVTAVSSAALTLALAVLVSAQRLMEGLPYADVPIALLLIGGAASAACLASAAGYFAQTAVARGAAGAARTLSAATVLLMTVGYLAFGAGGLAFTHFGLAAASRLARTPPASTR